MLKKAKQAGGADIAITNGGGIRSGIAKGEITLGDVLTVMPFGNTLYAADLTGAQIKEALEHGVSQVEEGGGAFPHVSGLSFTFTLSKPKGERILDVNLVNDKGDAVPLDLDKTYRVATNNFMGGGGDGYSVLKKRKRCRSRLYRLRHFYRAACLIRFCFTEHREQNHRSVPSRPSGRRHLDACGKAVRNIREKRKSGDCLFP